MLISFLTSLFALTSVLAAPPPIKQLISGDITQPDHNTTGASDKQIIQLALYIENLEVALL